MGVLPITEIRETNFFEEVHKLLVNDFNHFFVVRE